ncbi:RNA-binding protein PNO1 [Capsaspora owczarzaki ATCC 30864]|uniref:RNA-binding protein PNO1 n=1 Tax=Capsaspora owczarzaki (strain ATCC 30864) TaxID=595528 RepID=A0A0D2X5C6_CAPO3|nr:RNA-binding protein PNO1 [Capsaspora owczarzaki ATCC 30864]KJE97574.1 RNA-binding protein PNO1 [Capsaspora owczarzaki ATCC 30864]|eukprot:XP_004343269.2 RNA-binding protein PNO1 [Capsaspora owczarzaki ATCC 30864]
MSKIAQKRKQAKAAQQATSDEQDDAMVEQALTATGFDESEQMDDGDEDEDEDEDQEDAGEADEDAMDTFDASEVQRVALADHYARSSSSAAGAAPLSSAEIAAAESRPQFAPLSAKDAGNGKDGFRKVLVPAHRYTPLRENWLKIYTPLVQHMKLQIRMNMKTRAVELKTSPQTEDPSALQRGADFVRAFMLGFDIADAIALLRLDNLYIDTFEVLDVKPLHGEHMSRAIGRIAGSGGKTKFTIENVTKTRIVVADSKIHILGSFQNIKVSRDAIVSLILGSPPGKVYGQLRSVAGRMASRF